MLKVKIKYRHWYPRLFKVSGITIYPYIFLSEMKTSIKDETYKHEMHHIKQVRETGWFSFYSSYLFYYFAGLIRHKKHWKAYYENPYELEAYANENIPLDEHERSLI